MPKPRLRGGAAVAKAWPLLERCVEDGVNWGWQHAHKHVEHPEPQAIKERIVEDVMGEIGEWFDFPEAGDG